MTRAILCASVTSMSNAPTKIRRHRKSRIVPILTSTIPDREKVPGEPHMVGYARVSMDDQSSQRQVDELVMAGVAACDIFSDTGTGAHMDRPGWDAVLLDLQPGDILVIHSLDRLSRDLIHTMSTLKELNARGVTVKILTMDFDSRTPMGRFVFSIMGAFAQFEREVIMERTMHGLAKARERGRVGGVPVKYTDQAIADAYKTAGTIKAAAKMLGCSTITVKRGLDRQKPVKKEANGE
jgi:DNA invertase Pin-like site-specific DNA recombinase